MPLDDRSCLEFWERAAARHPIDRALLLAAARNPQVDWADRPLGERDAALMALRCEWFGSALEVRARCPACAEQSVAKVDLRTFLHATAPVETQAGRHADRVFEFRPPTSRDLAAICDESDAEVATRALLLRLSLGEPREWSDRESAAIEAELDRIDPLAHIGLDMRCTACDHRWIAPLDIAELLWEELDAAALRIVDEVHWLASGYGWSEAEILAMPAARRRRYIGRLTS
ncbi:conserved hypothetical protein [Burkholderiales bacterium 8X]|nr:conserved hypothetical protein [Burkholderiales bacterium 8X]